MTVWPSALNLQERMWMLKAAMTSLRLHGERELPRGLCCGKSTPGWGRPGLGGPLCCVFLGGAGPLHNGVRNMVPLELPWGRSPERSLPLSCSNSQGIIGSQRSQRKPDFSHGSLFRIVLSPFEHINNLLWSRTKCLTLLRARLQWKSKTFAQTDTEDHKHV